MRKEIALVVLDYRTFLVRVLLAGWGTVSYSGPVSPVLMEVAMPVWNQQRCMRRFAQPVMETNLCAGAYEGGKDSCQVRSSPYFCIRIECYFMVNKCHAACYFNPLNAELNPICYLLALLGAHHFLHVSRIRVTSLTLRLRMPYVYIYIYDISSLRVKRKETIYVCRDSSVGIATR